MRKTLFLGAFVALAAALPHPQDQDDDSSEVPAAGSTPFPTPTVTVDMSISLNIPVTTPIDLPTPIIDDPSTLPFSSKSRRPHWEPIPVFTKECKCNLKTARYPCWATDALQSCYYEENFSYGCYVAAAGGCATPTRVCSALYKPTPRPGPHPCELRPPPGDLTSALPSSVPALPTGNITLPGGNVSLPSGNVSWPTPSASLPVAVSGFTTVSVGVPATSLV